MPKVFIFTASTGAGHNLAARSMAEVLGEAGMTAEVYDAFKESSAVLDKIMTAGYKQLVEYVPKLYEQIYNQFNHMTPFQQYIFRLMARKLNPEIVPLIQRERPQLIISTHPIVTNMLGTLKGHGAFDVPLLSFVTDYKIHGAYINDAVDAYVVGSEYTKETMTEKGVNGDIVYPFGIPVRPEFAAAAVKTKADPEDPNIRGTILVMAGSLGTKQMEKAFAALMKAKEKIRIIVVCGNNPRVERSIEFLNKVFASEDKIVEIYGFVDNVPELMDRSDAIISKPGGLTTTEAICKSVPMIIPYYYPGQEEENADYLVESGMAIKIDKIKELTSMIDFLVENKYVIQEMAENMSEEARQHSMQKTVALCQELIDTYTKSAQQEALQ
ncbi:MAG: glycosyltransferase [Eubacterium sp.]|nr:glycosyltransferase [Eubacterium sp.]